MGIPRTSFNDRKIVKRVCELVGTRAARLAAVGIAGVVRPAVARPLRVPAVLKSGLAAVGCTGAAAQITKMNRLSGCTVAVDGSVFEHYPHFANRMRDGTSPAVCRRNDRQALG